MDPSDVHWLDAQRLLLGTAPALFLLEATVRAVVMYGALLVALRLLGKRMNGVMSVTDLALMLTLGAIVSVPMEMPERGMVPAIALLIGVLALQKLLSHLSLKYTEVEAIVIGKPSILIRDGVIDFAEVHSQGVTRQHIEAELRQRHIGDVSEVERMYLETNGKISVFKTAR